MRTFCCLIILFLAVKSFARYPRTPFEVSNGKRCATYQQCIDFYKALDSASRAVTMDEAGLTDAGLPLHVVHYSHSEHPLLRILINNSIHPGEPDGTDACMLLLRDLVSGKVKIPDGVELAVIPIYNVGGALNRGSYSRVNQVGPEAYGFRGNAENLDLNRDFTKMDSREAASFAAIFQAFKPDILIDNHVSDGADYQHTMTLLSTQYDKLGKHLGQYMRDSLDPAIYKSMTGKGWPMIPYVNFEGADPRKGWTAFYDPPRFSAGYAALFHTVAYTPETHMLKPFRARVESTYVLMLSIIRESAKKAASIKQAGADDMAEANQAAMLPLSWKVDTIRSTYYTFLGYEAGHKTSAVTGMDRLYYDRNKPFEARIPIHDHYTPTDFVAIPKAYIIPQGWYKIVDRLKVQGVHLDTIARDTIITVTAYHIDDYKTLPKAYESHYKHFDVKVSRVNQQVHFRCGDYIINTMQPAYRRFLVEMLEPAGDDSYFSWNFFDAILQQKEGYSDYRWEDVAAQFLKDHPEVRRLLDARKKEDAAFAKDAAAQLRFVYQHSPWYEPEHLRYPVFRID